MSRYVIEIRNARLDAPSFIHPGRLVAATDEKGKPLMRDGKPVMNLAVTATGVLMLHPGTRQNPSCVLVTSDQFLEFSYEIEAKSEGKYGCEKEIELYAVDVDTGERVLYSYAKASELVAANLNDDAAAIADQKKQEAEIQKMADDRDDAEKESDEQDAANAAVLRS